MARQILMRKPGQTFVFRFRNIVELSEQASAFAGNCDIDFDWFDAAVVVHRLHPKKLLEELESNDGKA